MMFMVPGVYTGYVVALAWISNSLPRPPAKRAAALAFINAISNTSSIYASYMYSPKAGKLITFHLEVYVLIAFSTEIRHGDECQLCDGHYVNDCSHDTEIHSREVEQEAGARNFR